MSANARNTRRLNNAHSDDSAHGHIAAGQRVTRIARITRGPQQNEEDQDGARPPRLRDLVGTGQPQLVHALWCVAPVLRASESLWQRGVIRWRCLGCGARIDVRPGGSVTEPRPNREDSGT